MADEVYKYTGVMVGFFLRPIEAQRLALSGGEEISDLHITLAFLGDGADLAERTGDENFAALRTRLEEFARNYMPLDAVISGFGRFTTVPQGSDTPLYASVDCPALPEFRQQLIYFIENTGYPIDRTHGYTPHVTLAYLPAAAPTPIETVPPVDLRFEALTLAVGGVRYTFPLSWEAPEDAPAA